MPDRPTTRRSSIGAALVASALVFLVLGAPMSRAAEESVQRKPAENSESDANKAEEKKPEAACTPAPDRFDFSTLEDLYGDSGEGFLSATDFDAPLNGQGQGGTEVKLEWRELATDADKTD